MAEAWPNDPNPHRGGEAVGDLIAEVRPEQWKAPTPCPEWNVRDVVNHLAGMDQVFTALIEGGPMPERGADRLGDDPVRAYRASNASLQAAFARPGVLERSYLGPLGSATGAERLQIRLYDLLAHGWDLGRSHRSCETDRGQLTAPEATPADDLRTVTKSRPREFGGFHHGWASP